MKIKTISFVLLAALISGVAGAAPQFVRKDTWLESVLASRAAFADDVDREPVWELTTQFFPDQLSCRECRIEQRYGLWGKEAGQEDWPTMAMRYARGVGKASPKTHDLVVNCKGLDDLRVIRDLFYAARAESRLALAEKTLEFVERSAPRPQFAAQLKELQGQLADAAAGKISGEKLYAQACELRRQIILSHPALDFAELLINKRSGHLPNHMCDQYLGRHSQAAPGLVVLDDWKNQPREKVLLAGKLPVGAILQPSLSFDGKRVLFAYADHANKERGGDLRGYYIYEYDFDSGGVRQITGTDRDPMEGREGRETVLIEDTAPCYLPDGGIAFISTRSQQYGRCHGARYVPSYTLYRGEADGSKIRALSFNESNEWAPSVLPDGNIIYCRWDYVDRHDTIYQSLWTIHPDGTQTAHYYGNNSRSPCLISEAKTIPGSYKTVATCGPHHGQTFGTIVVVDPHRGQEQGEPLTWITPECGFPEAGVPEGITKAAMPPDEDMHNGQMATPWPLSEDLFLCTGKHGEQFAIYLVDTLGGRELIYQDAKISCFDPIPLRPRAKPAVLASSVDTSGKITNGIFSVEDVYQSTQPIPRGTIAALRVNEIISQPTRGSPGRSCVDTEVAKKILGTVPVNADGSVAFEAPAAKALQFQLLDTNGMAVMTMRSLVYLQPGERASCVGCHESREGAPPPLKPPAHGICHITPPAGPQGEQGFSFVRTVQPVLDRYCISCHGAENPAAGIELTGSFVSREAIRMKVARKMGGFSIAYESLVTAHAMVKLANRNSQTPVSKPDDYFARAGRLAPMLLAGHPDKNGKPRVQLDRESFQRIADWLDLNAQFYGDYSHTRVETRPQDGGGEKVLRAAIEKRFGAELAKQPFATLVNVAEPGESRILKAPLPAAAGGWGQIAASAFRGADDPDFQEMRRLVEAAITPLKFHDIAGTCGREEQCSCGDCWVRKDLEVRRQKLAALKSNSQTAQK